MPMTPLMAFSASDFCRLASLPTLRRSSILSPCRTATPAESYPRYSSFARPAIRIGTASWLPTYPTIPHIGLASRSEHHRDRPFDDLELRALAAPAGWPV